MERRIPKPPPFYPCLEADALLWGIEKCRFYALSSRFPFYTCSDHMPLQWMNKSQKGPVSQFIIENLSELETFHQCVQGPSNVIPDSASRYPMLWLGWAYLTKKNAARRDHAHRDRRGLFSIHTKYGLLNCLPTKVSFSIFD
jgi:hypothetical protein